MGEDHFLNLQPGTIVNGRYEVVKCLGTGSMGMVYACRHRELGGHIVAMKVLFSEVARDEVAAARFRNEIVASYGVSHPNVVRAYEYFRDGDLIAFTMEYVGGGDLADRINARELIEIDEVVRMLSQMSSGVQAIHDAGIIHRDLKPENILLTPHGDIKITDFGIARTGTGPKLTEHGGVVGTIDYVSPEYLERGEVDERSDIYALGVLAYEMVTGEPPFKGNSVIETMTLRLRTDPEPPEKLRPECPPKLSKIILHAMERDPDKRYQLAREMFDDLKMLSSGSHPVVSPSPVEGPRPLPISSGHSMDMQDGPAASAPLASKVAPNVVPLSPRMDNGSDLEMDFGGGSSTPAAAEKDDYFFGYQQLDTVLSARSGQETFARPQNISISHSSLSNRRLNELSQNIRVEDESFMGRFFWYVFVALVGLGAGLMAFRIFKPELFGY